jgi:hypothetical protein
VYVHFVFLFEDGIPTFIQAHSTSFLIPPEDDASVSTELGPGDQLVKVF